MEVYKQLRNIQMRNTFSPGFNINLKTAIFCKKSSGFTDLGLAVAIVMWYNEKRQIEKNIKAINENLNMIIDGKIATEEL